MNRLICGLVLLCLLGLPASGKADIIFTNFGPGDTYFVGSARSLWNDPRYLQILGCAFTPTGSYYLDSVKLAAFCDYAFMTTRAMDVLLMSDKNGLPGGVIESIHIADASGDFGSKPLVANSALRPILDSNTQYWIVASLPNQNTEGFWAPPIKPDPGPEAEMYYSPPGWQLGDPYRFAFSVSGTPTPEPSTLLLLSIGTLALIGWTWQRSWGEPFYHVDPSLLACVSTGSPLNGQS